jgi:hypothetical protein
LRTVPRGVTLQAIRWPPINRPPTIPKDKLTPQTFKGLGGATSNLGFPYSKVRKATHGFIKR